MPALTDLQLCALLDSSECRLVERKQSQPNGADLRRTLVAFANTVSETECAVLFIGVGDDGVKHGVQEPDKVQREVRRVAENECYPPVHCELYVIKDAGVEIVAVAVNVSRDRPHFAGPAYVRIGSESVKASQEMFNEMVAARNDKARRILAERGKLISVQFVGSRHPVEGAMDRNFKPREYRDYRIDECNAHYVRLTDVNMGCIYGFPLEHVAVGYDSGCHRLRLIVNEHP